jgi:N utilization substance protein B
VARRRKSREIVFAVLFQLEHGQDDAHAVAEEILAQRKPGPEVSDYARRLLAGILEQGEEIDGRISASLEHWSLKRLAATDRSVLRLAVGELLTAPDTPAVVIINEAVDLAERYGTGESGGFVNGVLDRIARGMRPEEMKAKHQESSERS